LCALFGTGIGIGTAKNGECGMTSASTKSCTESIWELLEKKAGIKKIVGARHVIVFAGLKILAVSINIAK
jgi:hypothetical protein